MGGPGVFLGHLCPYPRKTPPECIRKSGKYFFTFFYFFYKKVIKSYKKLKEVIKKKSKNLTFFTFLQKSKKK